MCFVNCRTGMRPLSSILLEPAATDPCSKPSQMSLPLNESCTFHVIRPHCQGMSAFCTKRGSFWNGFVLLICSLRQCTSNASPHWFRIAASNHHERKAAMAVCLPWRRVPCIEARIVLSSRRNSLESRFQRAVSMSFRLICPQNVPLFFPRSRINNTTGKAMRYNDV